MRNLNLYIFIIIATALAGGIIFYANSLFFNDYFLATLVPLTQPEIKNKQVENVSLEDFAKCLAEKEIKLYGAAWDSHTQNQKDIFGESKKHLLYVECMEEEKGELAPECQKAKIKSVPTWILAENKIITGKTNLETLSVFSDCPLEYSY